MTPEQLFDHAVHAAKLIFDERLQVLPMMLWLREDGRTINPVAIAVPEKPKRAALAETMRRMMQEHRIIAYAWMAEAWAVEGQGIPLSHLLGAPLETHPDRREIIDVFVESKHKHLSGSYYILRPEHGRPKLSPFKRYDGPSRGTFCNLLTEGTSK